MRELTKEQVRQRLAAPNGSELLFGEAEAAFGAAWALFAEEGNAAACAFLCRCAKRQAYAAHIGALLGEDRTALYAALRSDAPKLRKNAARLAGALADARDVPALVSALAAEEQRLAHAAGKKRRQPLMLTPLPRLWARGKNATRGRKPRRLLLQEKASCTFQSMRFQACRRPMRWNCARRTSWRVHLYMSLRSMGLRLLRQSRARFR